MWMGEIRRLFPAQKLGVRICRRSQDKLYGYFPGAFCVGTKKNSSAVRTAQVLIQTELPLNQLPAPLFPIFSHLRCLNGLPPRYCRTRMSSHGKYLVQSAKNLANRVTP